MVLSFIIVAEYFKLNAAGWLKVKNYL